MDRNQALHASSALWRRPLLWLALALFLLQAWRYLSWSSDDAFITLRYAERLAHGKGLTFNDGERTDVFSNLLWPLTLAGLIKAGVPPLLAMKGLGLACGLVVLVLVSRLEEGLGLGAWTGLGALWTSASTAFVLYSGGGLENPMAGLLLLLGWLGLARSESRGIPPGACVGLAFAAATLARLDVVFAFLAVGLPWVWRAARGHVRWASLRPFLLSFALPIVISRLLMTWYYGTLLPTPYLIKATGPLAGRLDWGLEYASGLLGQNLVPLLCAAGALAPLALPRMAGPAGAAVLFAAATLTHWVWVGGDRCFDWYRPLAILTPVLAPWAAAGAVAVVRRLGATPVPPTLRTLAAAGLVALGVLHNARQTQVAWQGIKSRTGGPGTPENRLTDFPGHMAMYPAISEWLLARAKPGAVLVYDELGYIPFATGLATIDPTGLTDRRLAELYARHHYAHYFQAWIPRAEIEAMHGEARTYILDGRRPDYILYPAGADGHPTGHLGMAGLRDDPRFRERFAEAARFEWKGVARYIMFQRK